MVSCKFSLKPIQSLKPLGDGKRGIYPNFRAGVTQALPDFANRWICQVDEDGFSPSGKLTFTLEKY